MKCQNIGKLIVLANGKRFKGAGMMGVSDNIKRIRKQKGWTQKDLAEKLGISQAAVSHFELSDKDSPVLKLRLSTLEKLAEALDVELTDLISEPQPDPNVYGVRVTEIVDQERWYDIEFHTPYYDEYIKVCEFCKKLVDERKHRYE
jgi:transcriptional regulator with XRE-family HTH domain